MSGLFFCNLKMFLCNLLDFVVHYSLSEELNVHSCPLLVNKYENITEITCSM